MYTGNIIINEKRNIYPKKLGILTPLCSAIDLTIKLGPFPMYVKAPKNTAPNDMARKISCGTPATITASVAWGMPCATVWNATAVGELSKKADKNPAP